jgi:hypothetical protein
MSDDVSAEQRFAEQHSATVAMGVASTAALLDTVAAIVRRFVVLDEYQVVAVVLWIAHTHALDAFDVTPYLSVSSPERRSGKTRLLDVLELLVARPWRAVEPSEAVVFRKIDATQPTLLLDEVDAIFGRNREHEGLRALLNAGNARGTKVPRCVGQSQNVVEFSVFCAKAFAGIGSLPDTVGDRSVPIAMKRKVRGERCERFRRRRLTPEAEVLRDELDRFAEAASDALRVALDQVAGLADDGGLLASLDDRAFEAWEPLLAVAALAGEEWEARARAAALALSGGRDADPESVGLRLLADVRAVFERERVDRISSQTLAAGLAADADSPWADWYGKAVTPRAVARLLHPFGVRPRTVRFADETTAKGYQREWFADAWRRYAPASPAPDSSHPSQPSSDAVLTQLLDPSHDPLVTDRREAANPRQESDVTDVTEKDAQTGTGTDSGSLTNPLDTSDHHASPADLATDDAMGVQRVATTATTPGPQAPASDPGSASIDYWECPCGNESQARPGEPAPAQTVISLREPACPFCKRTFKEEYRRAGAVPSA